MQGKTINGYTLQHLLGVGGMAEVWYAENAIGKKAAVKMLLPKFCNDEAIVSRFENEAKVMVQLDHPNIRQVYDYGSIDGRPSIVMEYLEGDDLKAMMKNGHHFTDAELRKWWNQIADALNYTHAQGVVHRDIKPSNIFLDKKSNIKLLDFGIAKIRESISMTQTGATMGTLMYMSPEQVKDSKHIGPESDVYSLAVSFVHMITGKKPYDSDTTSDYDIRKGIVEIPLDLTGVPADWQAFLRPYLEKDPAKRAALRHFESDTSSSDPSSGGFAIRPTGNGDLQSPVEDEGTMVSNDSSQKSAPKETLSNGNRHSGLAPLSPKPKDKPKKTLWIALAAAVVAAIAAILLLRQPKSVPADPETEAFLACQTVADYKAFCNDYGKRAVHYAEAQHIIDSLVADSIAVVQDSLARMQAVADSLASIQRVKDEDEAYQRCTTLAGCDNYLRNYPQGRYVAEVQAKRAMLAISITTTKNNSNIVYRGIDNPIAVAGVSGINYYVTAEGGTLTNTGNGKYNFHVNNDATMAQVNVSSGGSLIGSVKFTVKNVPNPTPIIRNVVNGQVTKTALLAANRLSVELKDFNYDGVYFSVVGYRMRYKTKAGTNKIAKSNRASFTDEIVNAIGMGNVGDKYVFDSIVVKGNDNKIRVLGDIINVEIK